MIILRYNSDMPPDEVVEIYKRINNSVNDECFALPQDWDILCNCSIDDLVYFKSKIEDIIERKMINESKTNL